MARILVADDDASVRAAIRKALVAAGHTVDEAAEGRAALELYQQEPRDLVLMDLYMPGMDGLETIIRLKALRRDVKLLAMSGGGYRDKHDVLAMALQAGASGTLAKPFDMEELLAAVSAALGSAEVRSGSGEMRRPAKATVLLVEDDERARSVLRKRLTLADYAVVEVPNAERALEQFRAQPTDVVITDLILPGMSGVDLITALRAEAPTVGIVAISGEPDLLVALGDRPAGSPVRTLPKPFTTEQLLDALEAVLRANRRPDSPGSWLRRVLGWLTRIRQA